MFSVLGLAALPPLGSHLSKNAKMSHIIVRDHVTPVAEEWPPPRLPLPPSSTREVAVIFFFN